MHHQHYFNQLPPLKQSLSNSSLLSDTTNNNHAIPNHDAAVAPSSSSVTDLASTTAAAATNNGLESRKGVVQFPPIDRHQATSTSPTRPRPRGDSGDQRPETMYPNYVGQYSTHQLGQNVYASLPQSQQSQQQQQQHSRLMPSGASQALLPPVYPQPGYAAPSLSGQLSYETLQPPNASQSTPMQHTLASSNEASAYIGTRNNYKYELRVEQQPQRARMCGFGDKDRRPITPPPCVRLIVRNINTDEEVDVDKIDGAFFVLQVDLWNDTATQEVNVIRASSSAPTQSISTAVPMSYPPPAINQYMDMGYGVSNNGFGMGPGFYPPYVPQTNSHVMYTRNLIGSLTVNASLLKDIDGNLGYWFVLSDLSVRTEGWFRLRMTFIDVGLPQGSGGESGLNRSKCPILADIFSDKFQVYSAKKFPGVIESTPLSKCFAAQGIKIPIRKDGKGDKNDDDD